MASYIIEVRYGPGPGKTNITEAYEGSERDVRQRAEELAEKTKAASVHVYDANDHSRVYQVTPAA